MVAGRFILLLVGIAMLFSLCTYLLHRFVKRSKLIKYFPALAALIMGIFYLYQSTTPSNGFEDIARIIMAIMAFMGFIASLSCGLLLDFILPRYKRT